MTAQPLTPWDNLSPLHQLAVERLAEQVADSMRLAVYAHRDEPHLERARQAAEYAVSAATPGVTAAVLLHLAEHLPGVTPEQGEWLHGTATETCLDVVEDLTGANGGGGGERP